MADEDAAPGDTPYFLAAVALEQYRTRLLQLLRFVEETGSARLSVPPAEVEGSLNAMAEYTMVSDAEFSAAQARLREFSSLLGALADLRARTAGVRGAIHAALAGLEAERARLGRDIAATRALIARIESDPPLPPSPYDALGDLALFVENHGAGALPAGWRLGHPLPGQEEAGVGGPGAGPGAGAGAKEGAGSGMAEDEEWEEAAGGRAISTSAAAVPAGAGADEEMAGAAASAASAAGPAMSQALPVPQAAARPQAAASGAGSGAAAGPPQAQAAARPAAPAAGGAGSTGAAAASGLLSMVGSLPPAARAKLLALLPPGWKPGDPLPPSLLAQDPRKLMTELLKA